ncbi:unnamed protein product [Closterium sp. NIES-54]
MTLGTKFGDEAERPHWAELLRTGVAIFDLDYDAILAAMYALSVSTEGDCYQCVPPDPGLHLPSFSTILVSTAALHDAMVTTTTPGGQRVLICTCTQTGRHLATSPVGLGRACSVDTPCSCRLLSHQTLLWHHRLGHPSLPRLRGMRSRLLVSGLPRSPPPLPPSPPPPCLSCVEGWQRAAPHSSSFPPTTTPLQTLHMDVVTEVQDNPASEHHVTAIKRLKRVLLVPGLCANLLSTNALSEAGMKMEMMGTKVFKATLDGRVLWDLRGGKDMHQSMWEIPVLQWKKAAARLAAEAVRGGHASHGEPKRVGSCETCLTSKFSRFPFHSAVGQASDLVELVHVDLVEKTKVKGDGGALYSMAMVYVDTRLAWSFPLAKKSDAARVIIEEWLPMVERESGKWVKAIRSDCGGEFLGAEFQSWLKQHSIKQQLTTANTPQSNGVAERANRTIMEGRRMILVDSALVPMEKWSGKKPLVDMLRVFGCMGLVHVPKEKHDKLQVAAVWAVHLGLGRESKGWLMWDPKSNTIFTTRDAKFMEGLMLKVWSERGRSKVTIPLGIDVGTNDQILIPIELSSSSEMTEVSYDLGGAEGGAADVEEVLQQGEAPPLLVQEEEDEDEKGAEEEMEQICCLSLNLPHEPASMEEALAGDVREAWLASREVEF